MNKPFNEYTYEEQKQLIYFALVQTSNTLSLAQEDNYKLTKELEQATYANQALKAVNSTFSAWNYYLWFAIAISFIFGFWLRGL